MQTTERAFNQPRIIRPSLMAFPLSWTYIAMVLYAGWSAGDPEAKFNAVTILLPWVAFMVPIMLMATYGRQYVVQGNTITKINRITGDRLTMNLWSVVTVRPKPIVFGYGHMIYTLCGGVTFKMKNIKLPPKGRVTF